MDALIAAGWIALLFALIAWEWHTYSRTRQASEQLALRETDRRAHAAVDEARARRRLYEQHDPASWPHTLNTNGPARQTPPGPRPTRRSPS